MNTILWKEYVGHSVDINLIMKHPNKDHIEIFVEEYTTTVGNIVIKANKGYCTDFASVPKILKWFIDYDDPRIKRAAVCHDILFNKGFGNRAWAANIMFKCMVEDGIQVWKARIIKRAVSGLIAGRLFDEITEFDKANSRFSNISVNV